MNYKIEDFRNLIGLLVNHSRHQYEKLHIINQRNTKIQIENLLIEWNKINLKLIKTLKDLPKENKKYHLTTNVFEIEKKSNKKYNLICFLNIDEIRNLNEKYKNINENNFNLNVKVDEKIILRIECINDNKIANLKRNEKIDLEFELIDIDERTYEGVMELKINYTIYGELIEIKNKKNIFNEIKAFLSNLWPFVKYKTIEIGNKKYRRPLATQKEIEIIEKNIFEKCNPFLSKINAMNEIEFKEFLNNAMFYDIERGIVMGQIPHKVYIHSDWFNEFENKLWKIIDNRLDKISDDFFKI